MPTKDTLGDRMKAREEMTRLVLPQRTWTVLRVDGRAFHSYTRGFERPFDAAFAADMDAVAVALADHISGAAFAYVQSDEISVLLTDFAAEGTQAWFGGVAAKMVSLSAAVATATLNQLRPPKPGAGPALFDSRVFTLDSAEEAADYFVWRQRDARKNSISMTAQSHFSHKRLQGLHSGQMLELLRDEAGVDMGDYPDGFTRGRVAVRETYTGPVTFFHKKERVEKTVVATRHRWVSRPAPTFDTDPAGWLLGEAVPPMPELAQAG